MNNPFDYYPDEACRKGFESLLCRIEDLKKSRSEEDIRFCRELDSGKMLGVLIAKDNSGTLHTLYAFSGQIGDDGFYFPGFVGPVFDYLQPDGYFNLTERHITRLNEEIKSFEEGELAELRSEYMTQKERMDSEIASCKEKYRASKMQRDARRKSGECSEEELKEMIQASQYEKGELRRLKSRWKLSLEPFTTRQTEGERRLRSLKERRRRESEVLQRWLFSNFFVLNGRGQRCNLSDIFSGTSLRVPPSGAGECCAPKLLQAAYRKGWLPVSIAEYWYGESKGGEVRIHGEHYPACRGKCLPVLSWMLQGIDIYPPLTSVCDSSVDTEPEILYENEYFCIVNKPSGLLSVPGKGVSLSLQEWLQKRYGGKRDVKVAHRLDRDTSGVIVATFGNESFKVMQSLFATRRVKKTYVAELDGDYLLRGIPRKGVISLPLLPDWLDRPRQKVDIANGKESVTEYEFKGVNDGRSRIIFHPLTGRTHQLRVHSASEMGLGLPIAGDLLYGKDGGKTSERLLLHAKKIEFTFPPDGQYYCFDTPTPF